MKAPVEAEQPNRYLVRRGLVANESLNAGKRFTETNLGIKLPAEGLRPAECIDIIGKIASRDLLVDEPITDGAINDHEGPSNQ